ncbi:MAG: peptidase [Enterobacteriaceae bacterium]|nr:peptidase [Enterobacteriaceae bacterium]
MLALTGCGNTRTVYVQVPLVQIPTNLTTETVQPEIPQNLTWGNSLLLNEKLLTALAVCNLDKSAIRKIEETRHENESKAAQ